MGELILFLDIEAAVVVQLEDDLADQDRICPVSATIPISRPSEFVTVQRVGGPRRDLVTDSPSLMFDCYAGTGSAACSLANLVRALVHSWAGTFVNDCFVYQVTEFAGPQLMPDPRSTQSRYRFTASLDVRGTTTQKQEAIS